MKPAIALVFRPATVLITLMLTFAAAGCTAQTDTPAAKPTPSTSTSAPSPASTEPESMTTAELAWLAALPKLTKQMDAAYRTPAHLSDTVLATTADKLRGCSRELARLGAPSVRLQPVYVLVKEACQAYDKGATCFATAASIGIPEVGSADSRKQSQAIECGFNSSGRGGVPLAEAYVKGEKLKFAAA